MNNLDWNRERYRTRDLLLDYNKYAGPPRPRSAGLGMIYPWENISLITVANVLYQLAASSGFIGNFNDFLAHFGSFLEGKSIIYANFEDFPELGDTTHLYFDLTENILYYWDGNYFPVNAMLITNTIIQGGEA